MALVQFSGLASGIDSQSLIKAILTQQRSARITPLEDKNTELQETNSALTELKSLLTTLKSKADKFRTLSGGALSKLATSSDESVVTASASNSAASGSYNITASQLAKNGTATLASLSQTYSSGSALINSSIVGSANVDVTVGLGAEAETINVSVDATTTLDQFVSSYNSQATKSVASVINVGTSASPDYQVMFSTDETGTEQGNIQITVDPLISGSGSGAFNDNSISQATDALLTLDGVGGTITRASNNISDLINGVSFSLQGTGSSTINIATDASSSSKAVSEFVEAYNAVVEYIAENDLVTTESGAEGNENTFGTLAKINLDDSILSTLRQSLSSSSIGSGNVRILADLGITTNRDGTLSFDEETFEAAVDSDEQNVTDLLAVLGDDLAEVNGVVDQFTRFGGLIDLTFNAQSSVIKKNQERISTLESQLARQEESLIARFSRLEALMGKMQSQQASLGSILSGLS